MSGEAGTPTRTRRFIIGGLIGAAAVAVTLALIFTVGGVGKSDNKAKTAGKVGTLDTNAGPVQSGQKPIIGPSPRPNAPAPAPAEVAPGEPAPKPTTKPNGADALINLWLKPSSSGDNLLAAILGGTAKKQLGGNVCTVTTGDELADAVVNQTCPTVFLVSTDDYVLSDQIALPVGRRVTVMGHPSIIPTIDGSGTVRSFQVNAGAFLELKFLRIKQGGGITRARFTPDQRARRLQANTDNDGGLFANSQVVEIRGGAVAVEMGGLGLTAVNCFFVAVANTPASVQSSLTAMMTLTGGRIYGGHLFMASGVMTLFNCHFWDTVILLPFTDQISLGGDVLVLAGAMYATGCTWTATELFGSVGGLGFNIGVLGGIAVYTFCMIQGQGIYVNYMGPGQIIFLGGGIFVITGVDFRFACAGLGYIGVGDFYVGGGGMFMTGFTIENTYGALLALGAGFYQALTAGIMTQTGMTYTQLFGPNYQALTGASIYVGSGANYNVGVSSVFQSTTGSYDGQGGFAHNSAGITTWIGCPLSVYAATFAFKGLGGVFSQDAGFVVYIGNPLYTVAALSYFAGLGSIVYVGAGSLAVGYSPAYAPVAKAYVAGNGASYWVQGNTNATGFGKVVFVNKDGVFGGRDRERAMQLGNTNGDYSMGLPIGKYLKGGADDTLLMARDISVTNEFDPKSKEMLDKLKSFVPQSFLDATERIQKGFGSKRARDLAGVLTSPNEKQPVLYVGSDEKMQCAYCNVPTVDGPGASRCDGAASCDEMSKNEMFDWAGVKFPTQHVQTFNLNFAVPKDSPLKMTDVRDALKAFAAQKSLGNVAVSAYDTLPDLPEFHSAVAPLPKARALDAVNDLSHHFSGALYTTDSATLKQIQALFADKDGLAASLGKLLGASIDPKDIKMDKTITIPAYNSPALLSAFASDTSNAAGTNAVRLVEPGAETVPVKLASKGKLYTVVMENFPGDYNLAVQLIGSSEVIPTKPSQTARTLSSADGVSTDKTGKAALAWTIPADLPPGEYYLKAADAEGTMFGISGRFKVLSGAARRKLYGPLMYA